MKTNKLLLITISIFLVWGCKDSKDDNAKALTAITVVPETIALKVGNTQEIKVTPVPSNADSREMPFKWESNNTNIATVSDAGLVTAVSKGSANIIVYGRVTKSISKRISVTVTDKDVPLTAIKVTPESLTLKVNSSERITATSEPENATGVSFIWSSENSNIATVSIEGLVSAKSKGTTNIVVKSGTIEKKIPVTVTQPFTISIGSQTYTADTLNYEEVSTGVKWFKFNLPEFVNGFGTLGKGLVVNTLEIDLSVPGNKIEICPASTATWGNIERPSAMYARKQKEYASTGSKPVAAINADFFLLSTGNETGYAYINNRPLGIEIGNGMITQTPFSWNNGFIVNDAGVPSFSNSVTFSGSVDTGSGSFPLKEINGFADAGELVLFNNLANSYPTDSAFAWSPYKSTMVSLSYPEGGWRTNDRMEFSVTGIDYEVETAIPAKDPYGGKDFNKQGAILVGNSAGSGNPNQTLGFGDKPSAPNGLTIEDKGTYWEIKTTGDDPHFYSTYFTASFLNATTASFSFEYQSATNISDFQLFFGKPGAAAGFSTGPDQILNNTGIDATDESKWQTYTLNLMNPISDFGWGAVGHTIRLDLGGGAGNHVLIRNMKITAEISAQNNSKDFLDNLKVGDKIGVTMDVKVNGSKLADKRLNVVGYQEVILQNGEPKNTWNEAHPRTAIGYSQDNKKVYFVVVDGRQSNYSVGATTGQMGVILKALGAYTGLNLDGGGSSCMVVNGVVQNKSSDGSERSVANGILVITNK